jgi:hypothetical protein
MKEEGLSKLVEVWSNQTRVGGSIPPNVREAPKKEISSS